MKHKLRDCGGSWEAIRDELEKAEARVGRILVDPTVPDYIKSRAIYNLTKRRRKVELMRFLSEYGPSPTIERANQGAGARIKRSVPVSMEGDDYAYARRQVEIGLSWRHLPSLSLRRT